jgi:hypothetical protein
MAIVKTISEILAIQTLAAGAFKKSTDIDVTTAISCDFFFSFAPNATTDPDFSTQMLIEGSMDPSGQYSWVLLGNIGSGNDAATSNTLDSALAVGATVMPETAASTAIAPVNSWIFIRNAILANSEWKKIKKVNAGVSYEFYDAIQFAQSVGQTWFNKGIQEVINIDTQGWKRLRVNVWNNFGQINRDCVLKVKMIKSEG